MVKMNRNFCKKLIIMRRHPHTFKFLSTGSHSFFSHQSFRDSYYLHLCLWLFYKQPINPISLFATCSNDHVRRCFIYRCISGTYFWRSMWYQCDCQTHNYCYVLLTQQKVTGISVVLTTNIFTLTRIKKKSMKEIKSLIQ